MNPVIEAQLITAGATLFGVIITVIFSTSTSYFKNRHELNLIKYEHYRDDMIKKNKAFNKALFLDGEHSGFVYEGIFDGKTYKEVFRKVIFEEFHLYNTDLREAINELDRMLYLSEETHDPYSGELLVAYNKIYKLINIDITESVKKRRKVKRIA